MQEHFCYASSSLHSSLVVFPYRERRRNGCRSRPCRRCCVDSFSGGGRAPKVELGWQVHSAQQHDPEDEETSHADAHDEVEVGPLCLLGRLTDRELLVVARRRNSGSRRRCRRGRGRRVGPERVIGNHSNTRHLRLVLPAVFGGARTSDVGTAGGGRS